MKILYHHRTASKDGQAVHIEEMIASLRALGHEVRVVAPGGESALVDAARQLMELGADVTADLSTAMRINPHLRVLSLNGYYDMATPFAGAEYDLKHMQLDKALQANISYRYYESGHMIYIHPESMKGLRRDLLAFYDSATE